MSDVTQISLASRLRRLSSFVLANFGPLIVFFVANHYSGLKVAIVAMLIWGLGELLIFLAKKEVPPLFFLFSFSSALLFGVIDLYSTSPIFFKYEAVATSVLTGLYFGATLLVSEPLLQAFAEKTGDPSRMRTPNSRAYLRLLTGVWTLYFFLKAAAYFYIAEHYDIEKAMALRSTLGSFSMLALLGGEAVFRRKIIALLRSVRFFPEASPATN